MLVCGAEGAAHAHLDLLMAGYDVEIEDKELLCQHYTNLYLEDTDKYLCVVEENNTMYNNLLITNPELT